MPSTCRNVVVGVTGQPLNHSSTTSGCNQLAAVGHDRSGGPGAGRWRQPRVVADSKVPKGTAYVVLAGLKPAWRCRSARTGRSQCLASSPVSCRSDRLCWVAARHTDPVEVSVSTSGADSSAGAVIRPRLSAAQLLAAKNTRPIRSLDDLAADTFESDEELEEFLAFTYAERHRDLA
jgi:hypothetical protein